MYQTALNPFFFGRFFERSFGKTSLKLNKNMFIGIRTGYQTPQIK